MGKATELEDEVTMLDEETTALCEAVSGSSTIGKVLLLLQAKNNSGMARYSLRIGLYSRVK